MTTFIHHRQLPAGYLVLVDRNGDTHITFTLGLTATQERQAYRAAVGKGDLPKRTAVLFPVLLAWRQLQAYAGRRVRAHPVASVTAAGMAAALAFGAYAFMTTNRPHPARPGVAASAAPARPRRRIPRQVKAKRPPGPLPIRVLPVVEPVLAVPGAPGVPRRSGPPGKAAPPVAPPSSPPVVPSPTPPVTPPPSAPPPRHRAPHVLCVRAGLLSVHLHLCL